jgi:hypothetical protein
MASNGSEQEGTSAGGKALDFEETNENGYSRGVRTYSRQVHSMITKMQPFVLVSVLGYFLIDNFLKKFYGQG